jgi:hypothetical protein
MTSALESTAAALENVFRIKFGLTKEFAKYVGFVKDGA